MNHGINLLCCLLFCANNVMNFLAHLTVTQWLQGCTMIFSIGASGYIMYNQHLSAKWKRKQDREHMENQKKQKDGGHK